MPVSRNTQNHAKMGAQTSLKHRSPRSKWTRRFEVDLVQRCLRVATQVLVFLGVNKMQNQHQIVSVHTHRQKSIPVAVCRGKFSGPVVRVSSYICKEGSAKPEGSWGERGERRRGRRKYMRWREVVQERSDLKTRNTRENSNPSRNLEYETRRDAACNIAQMCVEVTIVGGLLQYANELEAQDEETQPTMRE